MSYTLRKAGGSSEHDLVQVSKEFCSKLYFQLGRCGEVGVEQVGKRERIKSRGQDGAHKNRSYTYANLCSHFLR